MDKHITHEKMTRNVTNVLQYKTASVPTKSVSNDHLNTIFADINSKLIEHEKKIMELSCPIINTDSVGLVLNKINADIATLKASIFKLNNDMVLRNYNKNLTLWQKIKLYFTGRV